MFSVGNHWIQRHEYRTVRDIINAYQEVTCDQLASLIQQYPLSASTTVVVGPHAELEPS
jgi:predicted Zn-dependent peptidase